MTTSVKMTILRIMLLSVTLVFTPLLNYSMASTLDSTTTEPHDHLEASLSNHHHTSSENHDFKKCSLESGAGVCNHQADEQCATSCCVNILLMSSSTPVLIIPTIHQSHYNTFMQHAKVKSIDNQLRPPQYS